MKNQQKEPADETMEEIRTLGYIPKRNREHDGLAQKYQKAVRLGEISTLQKEEAEALTAAQYRR